MIELTQKWRSIHSGAAMGILVVGDVRVPDTTPQLTQKKKILESQLQERYKGMNRSAILQLPVMQA